MLSVVTDDGSTQSGSLIDEIVREGARRMLAAALEAEVNHYIAELAAETDERGHRLVVRNGHHPPRTVVTAAGPVEGGVPRVNDRRVGEATGERKRFSSKILAPWCRKSPKVSEVLPLLYLHGLSSGDFVPALEQFLGGTAGLSPATVTRLTKQWSDDHAAFQDRDLCTRPRSGSGRRAPTDRAVRSPPCEGAATPLPSGARTQRRDVTHGGPWTPSNPVHNFGSNHQPSPLGR